MAEYGTGCGVSQGKSGEESLVAPGQRCRQISYWRWVEAPAARSRSTPRNPAAALLVGERFEVDGRSQMRRLGTEAHADQVVPARSHQGVDHGREFLFPLGACGQDDGAGADDRPVARFSHHLIVTVREPAMAKNFQSHAGCAVQIGFKSQRLSLFVPGTQQPLYGQRTGQERIVTRAFSNQCEAN